MSGPRVRDAAAIHRHTGGGDKYVFGIATGRVQGCQLLFFVLQGIAVTVTLRFRPRGWLQPFSILATIAFNLVTSVLFFQSVQALFPFYSPRG